MSIAIKMQAFIEASIVNESANKYFSFFNRRLLLCVKQIMFESKYIQSHLLREIISKCENVSKLSGGDELAAQCTLSLQCTEGQGSTKVQSFELFFDWIEPTVKFDQISDKEDSCNLQTTKFHNCVSRLQNTKVCQQCTLQFTASSTKRSIGSPPGFDFQLIAALL